MILPSSDSLGGISSLLLPDIQAEITLGKNVLPRFDRLQFKQFHDKFHEFTLVIDHDVLENIHAYNPEQSRELIGEILNVTLKLSNGAGGENYFKGIVTSLSIEQGEGYHGKLVLTGHSPDFLLDGQRHLQCFFQESLPDVVDKLSASLKAVQSKIEVKPANGSALEYACQFKETNYAFLKRLASDLGEWFFYDGKKLFFGKPKDEEPIPLVYGKDSEKLKLGMKLKPLSFGRFAYDVAADKLNTKKAPDSIGGIGDYGSLALDKSKKLFKEESNVSLHIPQTEDRAAKNRLERHGADLFMLEGESRNHLLHVGAVADLKFSVQGEHKPSGKYRIIEAVHQLDAKGNYKNSFKAVPAEVPLLPAEDIKRPMADAQPAVVTENHDPDGLGRVQVKFIWQNGDVFTPFIRVLRPDFGADEKSGSNRGYFWIPEKGDQVLVQFMDGMPEQPYVAGAMAHGKNMSSSSQKKNNIKSISTRSGHKITLDDANGGTGITVEDPAGNVIHLDSQGKNMTITSPQKMTLNATDVEINASSSIKMNGKTITAANKEGSANTITLQGDLVEVKAQTTKITSGKNEVNGTTVIKGDSVTIN